jgi:mono/diheme cytochrome c family protein
LLYQTPGAVRRARRPSTSSSRADDEVGAERKRRESATPDIPLTQRLPPHSGKRPIEQGPSPAAFLRFRATAHQGTPLRVSQEPAPLPFRPSTAYDPGKTHRNRGKPMKNATLLGLLVLAASAQGAIAQQAGSNLTDQQKMGRQVFAQSCGVCHLPPSLGARTYGPALNKDAGGGDDDVMREFITNGTPRMPAFKYFLKPEQIEAIISYMRTVPVQAAAAPARRAGGEP